jgi:TP901 family phage tail tape measure protein
MADARRVIELIFSATDDVSGTLNAIGSGVGDFEQKVSAVAEPLANFTQRLLLLEAAAAGVALALGAQSIKAAGEFDQSFREITTLVSGSDQDFHTFRQTLLDFGANSAFSLETVTGATYNAVSAIGDLNKSVELITVAEKLSVAGRAELNDTTLLLASTLNAYGLSVDQAARFSDIFFTAVQSGQTTIPELADTLGRVAPLAASAGVSMEEVAAAVAALTKNGLGTAEAVTGIRGALSNIIGPSGEAAKQANALGIEFSTSALASKGLSQFLAELVETTGGSSTEMRKFFGSVEGLNAVLSLTRDGGKSLSDIIALMGQNAGVTETAYDRMVNTIGVQTQLLKNKIEVAFIAIGDPMLQPFLDLEKSVGGIFEAITTAAKAGAFDPLIRLAQEAMRNLSAVIDEIAANLPEALANIDYSGFLNELGFLGDVLNDLFGGVDLTTAEGLQTVLQGIVDLGTNFVAFTTGLVQGFTLVKDTFTLLIGSFDIGQTTASQLLGILGSLSIAFVTLSPLISLTTSAFSLAAVTISGLYTAAVALPGLIAGISTALQVLTTTNPVGLALMAATLTATAVASSGLGSSLVSTISDWLGFGNAAQATVEPTTAASEAIKTEAQNLGLLENPLKNAVTQHTDLTNVQWKLNETFDPLGLGILQLKTRWEEYDGTMQLVIESNNDYVQAAGLLIDKTDKVQDPVRQATQRLEEYITRVGEAGDKMLLFGDTQDLARKGFDTTTVAVRDAEGNITGYTQAITFAGDAMKDLGNTAEKELSKTAKETLAAQKQANEFELAWEQIQSQERQLVFQLSADIAIAQIQSGTELVKAAFESVNTTITSTGDTLIELAKLFADLQGTSAGSKIFDLLGEESRRRQEALDLQKELVTAQAEYLHAVVDRLYQGEAVISVTADGLEPELEAFMFKILERIQVRASAEAQQFLLGL